LNALINFLARATVPACQTPPDDLRPATPDDVKDALAFALRFDGRKHYPRANEFMAQIVAEHLLAHLERCGFVVMKNPDLLAHRSQG
jgi:hypothetical protein